MRWIRTSRASTGLLALGFALCLGHTATALDAQPLASALQDHNTATVVQFHPSDPTTVAELDRLAATSAADILAVCVGPGCTQGVTENIARERGWHFKLAFDPRDSAAAQQGPSAANVSRSPARSAVASLRPSLPFGGGKSAASGLTASASMPDVPRLVSARGFLVIALPVMLLGLGGVAFYMGSRRRSDRPVRDEDEERDLEAFVRSRHGRKRPPVR
jgi:hypothetical protein